MSDDIHMTRAVGTIYAHAPGAECSVARCSYPCRKTQNLDKGHAAPLYPLLFQVQFAPISGTARSYAACQTYLEV